ncbi:MAG: class I SAM-dependent methyltransferase [Gammaproteobacteria bacterium]|nr:class I SAM-dependent methyltransferase [Gammaproteobacteria bacterium]MBU1481743.1 class I SAM-dependent methyltransferase [Gammaproteobacteria bacterium]
MTSNSDDAVMEACLSGKQLYGNDFSQDQIDAWFADEAEGYFELTQSGKGEYAYGYHALNKRHGYSVLPKCRFGHVLGIGSAYGDELKPILAQSDRVTILEPSDGFTNTELNGVPVNYVKPVASGDMPFDPDSFDVITCLGVLHHIPNVSKIVNEFYRVVRPGGYVLVREPIISMGDWRKPRAGLTKRERGIPLPVLLRYADQAGFRVVRQRKCMFSLSSRMKHFVSGPVFNNEALVAIDVLISSLPIWPGVYHARNAVQKLRPTAVFLVLQKPLLDRNDA